MSVATRDHGRTEDAPGSSENQRGEMEEEIAQPQFPLDKLACLDEKLSRPRWVVPVLPDQELECLLNVAIELSRRGLDAQSEACQRFFREGLTTSFTKILTNEAVPSWKSDVFDCIRSHCMKLVILCVIKLPQDWLPLLNLLAMVFNPYNSFHTLNGMRKSESVGTTAELSEEELFARPSSDRRNPRGWLVDLINKFGELGGFDILLERFQSGRCINIFLFSAFLRPFGLVHEHLTSHTVNKYIMPILKMIPAMLENLTDDELRQLREDRNETKSDTVAEIIHWSKNLARRVSDQRVFIKTLECCKLKSALRQLQTWRSRGSLSNIDKMMLTSIKFTYRRQ